MITRMSTSKERKNHFSLIPRIVTGTLIVCLAVVSGCFGRSIEDPCQTRFENAEADNLVRDNLHPTGWFLDTDDQTSQSMVPVILFGGRTYPAQLDEFLECEAGKLYIFSQNYNDFPLGLSPNGQPNYIEFGSATGPHTMETLASTTYKMDPHVLVIPVYTWRFLSDRDGSGASADWTSMRYAFDKAVGSRLPTQYEDNYWAQERIDEIWSQCGIQFRHIRHTDVTVPHCWVWGVEYENPYSGKCTTNGCQVGTQVTEAELNQCKSPCLVRNFINYYNYYVPDAINIYFFGSFVVTGPESLSGLRCHNQIYINEAQREYDSFDNNPGRTIAHEIGHILLNDNSHEPGTLMGLAYQDSETDKLTQQQCDLAAAANPDILGSRLGNVSTQ